MTLDLDMKMRPILVLLMAVPLLGGCASSFVHSGYLCGDKNKHDCYAGTIIDGYCVVNPSAAGPSLCDWSCALLDLPFSFILDTFLLPFDIWEHSPAKQESNTVPVDTARPLADPQH